jgi:hypothetical protein
VRLFAALGCSAQPFVARLTLKLLAHHLKSGGALRAQAAQTGLYPLQSATPAFAVRLTTSKAVHHAPRFCSPVHWHMAWRYTATQTCLWSRSGMDHATDPTSAAWRAAPCSPSQRRTCGPACALHISNASQCCTAACRSAGVETATASTRSTPFLAA